MKEKWDNMTRRTLEDEKALAGGMTATKRIAMLRFQDELPKIIKEFGIKPPQDKRLWRMAKTDFGYLEGKVAYIKEVREAENKKLPFILHKPLTAYAGLLIWLLKKHKED